MSSQYAITMSSLIFVTVVSRNTVSSRAPKLSALFAVANISSHMLSGTSHLDVLFSLHHVGSIVSRVPSSLEGFSSPIRLKMPTLP